MFLPSHTAPHLNFSITYKRSVVFQMEVKIICRRGFGSQTTQIGHFTVVYLVAKPLIWSEAEGDLVVLET